jgi:hypothetical protein
VSDEKAGKRTGVMALGNQELFTAKDAEDAKEGKDLPRMCADERGLRVGGAGPGSASEPLDADTGAGSVLRPETYAVLG